jgi:hypothetical protein
MQYLHPGREESAVARGGENGRDAQVADVMEKIKEPFTAGKLKKEAKRDILKVIDKTHKPSAKETESITRL